MAALEYLSQEQVDDFYNKGYLCVEGVFSPAECDAMLHRARQLLKDFDTMNHPLTTFSTGEGGRKHVGDQYFLTSGDKIRFFFEEGAMDETGKLVLPKERAVNKIGHALHELDPVFRDSTVNNEIIKAITRDLKFHVNPSVLQSMVICKQQRIGGEVPEHCDSTFLYTDPLSALGWWIPLEQCTEQNGALSFLPGSHKTNIVSNRFVRLDEGGTGFIAVNSRNHSAETKQNGTDVQQESYKLLPCNPGDLVLIHGSVLHKSERNMSEKTRFAYTFHMIESPPLATYDNKNWLQPTTEMPFRKLLAVE